MTIVEFLHPLKSEPIKEICLAALYFHERFVRGEPLTVEGLRNLIKRARVPKAAKLNIADTLSKSAPYVEAVGRDGNRFLWTLTISGQDHVRSLMGLPTQDVEIQSDVSSLMELVSNLSDPDVADYLGEAIKCLQVGALRACVVFLWSGVVKKLRDDAFGYGAASVSVAVAKHDPKTKPIHKIDDLVLVKESVLLLSLQELGVVDKNERSILEECLNLRNRCGHPGKYKVGQKKVSSYIEDLVGIVFA